MRVLPVHA